MHIPNLDPAVLAAIKDAGATVNKANEQISNRGESADFNPQHVHQIGGAMTPSQLMRGERVPATAANAAEMSKLGGNSFGIGFKPGGGGRGI